MMGKDQTLISHKFHDRRQVSIVRRALVANATNLSHHWFLDFTTVRAFCQRQLNVNLWHAIAEVNQGELSLSPSLHTLCVLAVADLQAVVHSDTLVVEELRIGWHLHDEVVAIAKDRPV